ncbi:hypothetical protein F5Y15DRAFT_61062 [Xylariaceae sp. FL0016]|nr:hypothetical protein F5Y15DRAFT_61062 [Xylariaceae sp. FL0016]
MSSTSIFAAMSHQALVTYAGTLPGFPQFLTPQFTLPPEPTTWKHLVIYLKKEDLARDDKIYEMSYGYRTAKSDQNDHEAVQSQHGGTLGMLAKLPCEIRLDIYDACCGEVYDVYTTQYIRRDPIALPSKSFALPTISQVCREMREYVLHQYQMISFEHNIWHEPGFFRGITCLATKFGFVSHKYDTIIMHSSAEPRRLRAPVLRMAGSESNFSALLDKMGKIYARGKCSDDEGHFLFPPRNFDKGWAAGYVEPLDDPLGGL